MGDGLGVLAGVLLWFAMLQSGVHATLAGGAIGLITPATALLKEDVARGFAQRAIADHHLNPDELDRLRFLLGESVPVVERLQSRLHPLSSYVVLPVFALANAGVGLGGGVLGESLDSVVASGIAAGLVIGKPVGITLACFIAIRLGLGRLPDRTSVDSDARTRSTGRPSSSGGSSISRSLPTAGGTSVTIVICVAVASST